MQLLVYDAESSLKPQEKNVPFVSEWRLDAIWHVPSGAEVPAIEVCPWPQRLATPDLLGRLDVLKMVDDVLCLIDVDSRQYTREMLTINVANLEDIAEGGYFTIALHAVDQKCMVCGRVC